MDDLLSEFLTETNESLTVLDMDLVQLEQNPNDPELLSNIFRLMHTIKGTCGFLGLPRLESVAHAGENVLGKVRDGELEVTSDTVSIILECLDRIRSLLSALEETETEPAGDDQELIDRLNAIADSAGKADEAKADESVAEEADFVPVAAPNVAALESGAEDEPVAAEAIAEPAETTEVMASEEMAFEEKASEETASSVLQEDATPIEAEVLEPAPGEPILAQEEPVEEPVAKAATVAAASNEQATAGDAGKSSPKESSVANQSIRVNVGVLENLMTMVSELVLTRNQLLQILRTQRRPSSRSACSGSTMWSRSCRKASCKRACSRSATPGPSCRASSGTCPTSWARRSTWS